MSDLTKRAVACRHWRWLPGMLVHDIGTSRIGRVHKVGSDWVVYFGVASEARFRRDTTGYGLVPDLTDAGTLGCLLTLVREAWGVLGENAYAHPAYAIGPGHQFWCVRDQWGGRLGEAHCRGSDTETEALVAALEAAP